MAGQDDGARARSGVLLVGTGNQKKAPGKFVPKTRGKEKKDSHHRFHSGLFRFGLNGEVLVQFYIYIYMFQKAQSPRPANDDVEYFAVRLPVYSACPQLYVCVYVGQRRR